MFDRELGLQAGDLVEFHDDFVERAFGFKLGIPGETLLQSLHGISSLDALVRQEEDALITLCVLLIEKQRRILRVLFVAGQLHRLILWILAQMD